MGRSQKASVFLEWDQNTRLPPPSLYQLNFLRSARPDSLILIVRIQVEKPKLFLLWIHVACDSDGSKWRSGQVPPSVWLLSQFSVEKLLDLALLGEDGPGVIWFPLSVWRSGPTDSLEGSYLDWELEPDLKCPASGT